MALRIESAALPEAFIRAAIVFLCIAHKSDMLTTCDMPLWQQNTRAYDTLHNYRSKQAPNMYVTSCSHPYDHVGGAYARTWVALDVLAGVLW